MDMDMTLPPTNAPRAPPTAATHNSSMLWPPSSSPSSVSSSGSSGASSPFTSVTASAGRGLEAGGSGSLKRRWHDVPTNASQSLHHQVSATTTPLPSFKRLRIASGPSQPAAYTLVPTPAGVGSSTNEVDTMTQGYELSRNACDQDVAVGGEQLEPLSAAVSRQAQQTPPVTSSGNGDCSMYQSFNVMLGALHRQRTSRLCTSTSEATAASATHVHHPPETAAQQGYAPQSSMIHEGRGGRSSRNQHPQHQHKKKSVVTLPSHSRLF